MEEEIKHGLNCDSDFSAIAQAAIKAYYLIPYPNQTVAFNEVARPYHGAVHVSSVALNMQMLMALYQKYDPAFYEKNQLSPREEKLLLLTAIYHDSGNINEIDASPTSHGDHFNNDMRALGFTAEEIEPFRSAMNNKDRAPNDSSTRESLYQKLLHDADCLDVIRIHDDFDSSKLYIIHELRKKTGFNEEIKQIIENHRETLNFFRDDRTRMILTTHKLCEQAPNCYLAVKDAQKQLFYVHAFIEAHQHGFDLSLEDLDQMNISILDIYNRQHSPWIINQTQAPHTLASSEKQTTAPFLNEEALSCYQNKGLCIRGLTSNNLDIEFQTLTQNTATLTDHDLHNAVDIAQYVSKHKKQSAFKWRPFMFIKQGLPIELFARNCYIMLDPDKINPSAYRYKKDALSIFVSHREFDYMPTQGGLKNKVNLSELEAKLQHMNQRRIGAIPDPNLHYYGKKTLDHNEILTTYTADNVMGIIVMDTPVAAREALLLRATLGAPFRPFYQYSPHEGLKTISVEDVIRQSEMTQSRDNKFALYLRNHLSHLSHELSKSLNVQMTNRTTKGVSRTFSLQMHAFDFDTQQKITQLLEQQSQIHLKNNTKYLTVTLPLYTNDRELGDALEALLGDINEIISSNPRSQLLSTLDIEQIGIGEITQLFDDTMKAGYSFTHPNDPDIKCSLMIQHGIPTLIFENSAGQTFETETDLLPKIAQMYYSDETQELNDFLNRPDNAEKLNQLGLNGLTWSIEYDDYPHEKCYLIANVEQCSQTNQEQMIQDIQSLFYTKNKQSASSKKLSNQQDNRIFFDNIQHVPFFKIHFQQYAPKMIELKQEQNHNVNKSITMKDELKSIQEERDSPSSVSNKPFTR